MSKKNNLLFVDNEEDILSALYDIFFGNYNIYKTTNPIEALDIIKKENIALVISDQRMPEMDGSDLLAEILKISPKTIRILLTGYADIKAVIDTINKGAIHKYLEKPWENDELVDLVAKMIQIYEETKKHQSLFSEIEHKVKTAMKSTLAFKKFLDSYFMGVCIIGEKEDIEYINKKGLEITKYVNLKNIVGKNYKKSFLVNESNKNYFLKKYMKKDFSPNKLKINLNGGTTIEMQGNVIFSLDDKGVRMSGIVFN